MGNLGIFSDSFCLCDFASDLGLNEVEIILISIYIKKWNKWEIKFLIIFKRWKSFSKKTNFNICKSIENLFIKKSYSLYTEMINYLLLNMKAFHVTGAKKKIELFIWDMGGCEIFKII